MSTKDVVIGIDFGTTNSAIAGLDDNGMPRALKNAEGGLITPSFILFRNDGEPLIGQEAKNAAPAYPEDAVREIKRQIGKTGSDGKPTVMHVDQNRREWTAPELAALIIKKMTKDGEIFIGQPITAAVITVPANYNDLERTETANAGRIAGLIVPDVMNEPTAAAIAYGLDKKDPNPKVYLIFDLGGGTFDVTAVRIEYGKIIALAADGERNLGGADWSLRMTRRIVEEAAKAGLNLDTVQDPAVRHELMDKAERTKHSLSATTDVAFYMNIEGKPIKFTYTRAEFEADTRDLVERIGPCVERVLKGASLKVSDVADTVLIGGATRMPMIQQYVARLMGKPPRQDVDADLAVAQGAALAAAHMAKTDGRTVYSITGKAIMTLKGRGFVNVSSHPLGCAAFNSTTGQREFAEIIAKNTPLPATKTERFALHEANQTNAQVEVYQGQTSMKLEECLLIDNVLLQDLPLGPANLERIEVTYAYTRSGIVHVTVRDTISGKFQEADISHNLGMSEEEVKNAAGTI